MPYPSFEKLKEYLPKNVLDWGMQISAQMQGYLGIEHKDDGSHSHIHADDIDALSLTLADGQPGTGLQGSIRLYDELGYEIAMDATNAGTLTTQAIRLAFTDALATVDPGDDRASLVWLGRIGTTNGYGSGILLRKPATPISSTDGWAITVSEADSLLTGTSMLTFQNTREGDAVLLLRPIGAAGAVTSYAFGPKGAFALGATADLGVNTNGERWQNAYIENVTVNGTLTAGAFTVTTLTVTTINATTGNITTVNATNVNGTTVTGTNLVALTSIILGAATTAGIRLDLEGGTLAVREGDDSAYADMVLNTVTATNVNGTTVTGTVAVNGTTITGQTIIATSSAQIHSTVPQEIYFETDGGSDAKYWRFVIDGGVFNFQTINDAFNSVLATIFTANRSGQMLFNDGSVSVPGITFFNDPDLGFYRIGGNQIGVTCGNSLAAYFDVSFMFATRLLVNDGSVGTPGVAFASDPDNGMYRITTNQVGMSAGGTLAMLFHAGGVQTRDGSAGTPGFGFIDEGDMGMYRSAARATSWAIAGGERMRLAFPSSDVTSLYLNQGSFSAGSVNGCGVRIGRNSGGSGAAGWVGFMAADGTEYAVWSDTSMLLRISTAAPCANGSPADNSGTIVGTQSSRRADKHILGVRADYGNALHEILNTTVYDYTYKDGRYNGEVFTGITTDDSPLFGMDNGKSFNPVNAFSYLVNAMKAQQQQIDELTA